MNRRAFTIVELMVTLMILLLLISLGTLGFQRLRQANRDATRVRDIQTYGQAVSAYRTLQRGVVPTAPANLCAHQISGLDVTLFPRRVLPQDPSPAGTGNCPTAGYAYRTSTTSGQPSYTFEVALEQSKNVDLVELKDSATVIAQRYVYQIPGPIL